jgi:Ca2+-binding RTX toxin-like protein
VTGSIYAETLLGGGGDDLLDGGNANDMLPGGSNDSLNGGDGADTLIGGDGNDTLQGGEGIDIAIFSGSRAFYTVVGDQSGLTVYDNRAGTPDDVDLLFGVEVVRFSDQDVLVANGFEGLLVTGGEEDDTALVGTIVNDTLIGLGGNDSLRGLAGGDLLDGGTGNDTLDGGDGADTMIGGEGDDLYWITLEDVIVDVGGADTVMSPITWTMQTGIEALVLIGADTIGGTGNNAGNIIVGNGAANRLLGMGGNDFIDAGNGDDYLDGGTGADTMEGGDGNDFYKVDNVADVAIEAPGGGNDTVLASVNWTLGDNFETLQFSGSAPLIGIGNALDNYLIGNNGANWLFGGDGADTLNGGNNADTLEGGSGNDVYIITAGADVVIEAPGGGIDLVRASITHVLAAEVENLNLIGTANIAGTGNALDNVINGNAFANRIRGLDGADRLNGHAGADTLEGGNGNDRLNGGDGDDVLNGGSGFDTLAGGTGNDIFRYDQSAHGGDTISDFAPGADLFHVSRAGFGGVLALGALAGAHFANNAPTAAVAQFVYTQTTGVLTYDLDGTGAGAAVTIATLTTKPAISAADFLVIA